MRLTVTRSGSPIRIVMGVSSPYSESALASEANDRVTGDQANAAAAQAAHALAAAALPATPGALQTVLADLMASLPAGAGGTLLPAPIPIANLPTGRTVAEVAIGGDTRFPDEATATTSDATPTPMAGLRALPGGPGVMSVMRATGSVTARNIATGDVAVWDVSAAVKSVDGTVSLLGQPMVALFAADDALQVWASAEPGPLAATEGGGGIVLTVTGLVGVQLAWSGSFLMVVG